VQEGRESSSEARGVEQRGLPNDTGQDLLHARQRGRRVPRVDVPRPVVRVYVVGANGEDLGGRGLAEGRGERDIGRDLTARSAAGARLSARPDRRCG
jgi:hypothetical protein